MKNIKELLSEVSKKAHLSDVQLLNFDKSIKMQYSYDNAKKAYDLWIAESLTHKELAKRFDVSETVIRRLLKKHNFLLPKEVREQKDFEKFEKAKDIQRESTAKKHFVKEKMDDIASGMTSDEFCEKWMDSYKNRLQAQAGYRKFKKRLGQ